MSKSWAEVWHDRWKSFKPEEILSPIGLRYLQNNILLVQPHALDFLQSFRDKLGIKILVNSGVKHFRGFRNCKENNIAGGKGCSFHLQGLAFDTTPEDMTLSEYHEACKIFGWTGVGFCPQRNFVHIDLRPTVNGEQTFFSYNG